MTPSWMFGRRAASLLRRNKSALSNVAGSLVRRIGSSDGVVPAANRIRNRLDFAEVVRAASGDGRILEIGPFAWPLLRGPDIAYADVLTAEQIRARARDIGADADGVPEVDFIVAPSDLSGIDESFRAVVSCHVIEHQPDLIGHLRQVACLLQPGGSYFLIVPDRRYCADHYLPNSSLAELLAANAEKRHRHVLRSLIEHRVLTVHNDPRRHWQGDHGRRLEDLPTRLKSAIDEFATGDFIDLHAWHFDPTAFQDLMTSLSDGGQTPFQVQAVYPTHRDDVEFFAILVTPGR